MAGAAPSAAPRRTVPSTAPTGAGAAVGGRGAAGAAASAAPRRTVPSTAPTGAGASVAGRGSAGAAAAAQRPMAVALVSRARIYAVGEGAARPGGPGGPRLLSSVGRARAGVERGG